MAKDAKAFLMHVVDSIADIENYIKGVSHEEFMASHEKQDSVIRRLEVIGEAR